MKLARLRKTRSRETAGDADTPAPRGSPPCSVVGTELVVEGRIRAPGELRILGTVIGEVYAPRVVVCPGGILDGRLVAQEAVLQGEVRGQVFAYRVTAEDTAVIEGTVFHHELTMAPGVQLDGRTPWRPLNYFDNHLSDDFQGDSHEQHVHA